MRLRKFRTGWTGDDSLRFPLIVALAVLVFVNYRERTRGWKKDEWYWADLTLLEWGWWVDPTSLWKRGA